MRPTTTLELKVGLLVIIGIIATITLILMTDRIEFDRFYRVKAYVADAAGLRVNSPVTLDGIRIGEVVSLAPIGDQRGNIEIVLNIRESSSIPSDAQLTLASSGIFGDSFLAFQGSKNPNAKPLPKDGTAEVEAGKGFFDKASKQAENILAGVSDILAPESRSDIKRLLANAATMAENGAKLTEHLDQQTVTLNETLQAIKALSVDLQKTVQRLDTRVDQTLTKVDTVLTSTATQVDALGKQVSGSINKVDETVEAAKAVVTTAGPELQQMLASARSLAQRIDRIAAALENGDGIAGQLLVNKSLAADLNNTVIDLSRTADMIADHPEVLVFGMSNEESAVQRVRREREKQRRAFQEGYSGGIPLQVQPPSAIQDK